MNQLTKQVQEYSLEKYHRSNQDTCLFHKPAVYEGQWVESGDLLADSTASVGGELWLGQNILIAYMPWEGYNFEDAILISERLVFDDLYTSIHIERYEIETRETKLGVEKITKEIPDINQKDLYNLDCNGVIKLGSWVEEGDILVGKITPINKKTISSYQKLLYTILEKQVLPIRDSWLRAPKGLKAKVIDIKIFKNNRLLKNPYASGLPISKSSTFSWISVGRSTSPLLKKGDPLVLYRSWFVNLSNLSCYVYQSNLSSIQSLSITTHLPKEVVKKGLFRDSLSLPYPEGVKPFKPCSEVLPFLYSIDTKGVAFNPKGRRKGFSNPFLLPFGLKATPLVSIETIIAKRRDSIPNPLGFDTPLGVKRGVKPLKGKSETHQKFFFEATKGIAGNKNFLLKKNKISSILEKLQLTSLIPSGITYNPIWNTNNFIKNIEELSLKRKFRFLGKSLNLLQKRREGRSPPLRFALSIPNPLGFDTPLGVKRGVKPLKGKSEDFVLWYPTQRVGSSHTTKGNKSSLCFVLWYPTQRVGSSHTTKGNKSSLCDYPLGVTHKRSLLNWNNKLWNLKVRKLEKEAKIQFSDFMVFFSSISSYLFNTKGGSFVLPAFAPKVSPISSSHSLPSSLGIESTSLFPFRGLTPLFTPKGVSNPKGFGIDRSIFIYPLALLGKKRRRSRSFALWIPKVRSENPYGKHDFYLSQTPLGVSNPQREKAKTESHRSRAKAKNMKMTDKIPLFLPSVSKRGDFTPRKFKQTNTKSAKDSLHVGVKENHNFKIHVYLAEKRKIQVGDKMAGRHGNKGIVSQILSIADMPYLPNGTPVDMVLNPLGVPSRMNVGQIYECLLGLAGKYLGENFKVFPFDESFGPEASRSWVFWKLYEARFKTGLNWLFDPNTPGKIKLYDGRTGLCFNQSVTVGYAYMLRLVHMVDDKIHMRSTGPYSLVTQQPLRGRSKQGGQRLGEMEVWALEGYGAAFTLLEMLTIKSDDMSGRMTLWSNLILNKNISIGTPESFKVLVCELQALCLDIGLYRFQSSNNKVVENYRESKFFVPSTSDAFSEKANNSIPASNHETWEKRKIVGFSFAKQELLHINEIDSLINLP